MSTTHSYSQVLIALLVLLLMLSFPWAYTPKRLMVKVFGWGMVVFLLLALLLLS